MRDGNLLDRVVRSRQDWDRLFADLDEIDIGDGLVISIDPYPNKICPPGLSNHPLYSTWNNMMVRCYKEDQFVFKNYGGRGVTVCDEWHNFLGFLLGVGPRPGPEYSLDRIDVNGNYEPSNCRWATSEEQANNTRWNVFIEWRGERRSISQWAKKLGMSINVLHYRIRRLGMNMDDAVSTPVPKRSRHRGPDKAKRKPRGQRG